MTHAEQIEQLFVFAVCMLGSREEAFAAVCAATQQHPGEPGRWLPALVRPFLANRRATQFERLAELDDILRTHSTIPIDLSHPLIKGDAWRMGVLLAELQRTCLFATLRALTPERRAVFILQHVLGFPVEACATVCETTISAVMAAEGRGRRDLDRYLGARCEHMDPRNSCRCAARLGNALDRGLVRWPEHREHDAAPMVRGTHSKVSELYASLPRVRLPVID